MLLTKPLCQSSSQRASSCHPPSATRSHPLSPSLSRSPSFFFLALTCLWHVIPSSSPTHPKIVALTRPLFFVTLRFFSSRNKTIFVSRPGSSLCVCVHALSRPRVRPAGVAHHPHVPRARRRELVVVPLFKSVCLIGPSIGADTTAALQACARVLSASYCLFQCLCIRCTQMGTDTEAALQ